MAADSDRSDDRVGTAVLEMYPVIERILGAAVGFSIGSLVGCLLLLVPAFAEVVRAWSILFGGLIGGTVGVALPTRIQRPELASLPRATAGRPVPVGALGGENARLLDRPTASGLLLGVAVGLGTVPTAFIVHLLTGIRPSFLEFGVIAATGVLAAIGCVSFVPPFLLPGRTRSAMAAHLWLGGREFDRIFGSRHAVDGFPVTPEEIAPWSIAHPETDASREGHVEMHLLAEDWDAARATLDRLPDHTSRERFIRANLEAMLRYQTTGVFDDRAAQAARRRLA